MVNLGHPSLEVCNRNYGGQKWKGDDSLFGVLKLKQTSVEFRDQCVLRNYLVYKSMSIKDYIIGFREIRDIKNTGTHSENEK